MLWLVDQSECSLLRKCYQNRFIWSQNNLFCLLIVPVVSMSSLLFGMLLFANGFENICGNYCEIEIQCMIILYCLGYDEIEIISWIVAMQCVCQVVLCENWYRLYVCYKLWERLFWLNNDFIVWVVLDLNVTCLKVFDLSSLLFRLFLLSQ